MLNVDLSKQQQSSDWAATTDEARLLCGVRRLHLHQLRDKLDAIWLAPPPPTLPRRVRVSLPDPVALDLLGWVEEDIFAHS